MLSPTWEAPNSPEMCHIHLLTPLHLLPSIWDAKKQPVSFTEIQNLLQAEWAAKGALYTKLHEELTRKATKENHHTESTSGVQQVLEIITAADYDSLYAFVNELLNIQYQQLSTQVSRMLGCHREAILNSICDCQPNLTNTWTINISGEILAQESKNLLITCGHLKAVSEVLKKFSLERILSKAEHIPPMLCQILHLVLMSLKSKVHPRGMHWHSQWNQASLGCGK